LRRRCGDAIKMRLVRLRWEADDYLKRLGTEKAVHIVQAADRERQQRSRAIELSECVVAGRDQAAYERAMRPWPQERLFTIAPRLRRS
jgi:hypothetical protein